MENKKYIFRLLFLCLVFAGNALTVVEVFGASPVLGIRPQYNTSQPDSVPNEHAMLTRIWAPGLDAGYVPQGVAIADGTLLVSAYMMKAKTCRVFRIDRKSGMITGQFDLPQECKHAGGLEYAGNGTIYVADTHRLFHIALERALRDGHTKNALIKSLKLSGDLRGSFLAFDASALWVGAYHESQKKKIYRIPLSTLKKTPNGGTLKGTSFRSLPVAPRSQGAAFDWKGNLWLTQSSSRFGRLQKIDPRSGKVLHEVGMVIGIEEIDFDAQGRLWSISEAGCRKWSGWKTFFPIAFLMDLGVPGHPTNAPQAGVEHPNGEAYFFDRDRYSRFDFQQDRVDKFARIGIDGWEGLPAQLDAAILHPRNGKAYFFKGKRYYRFDFQRDIVDKKGLIGINGWEGVPVNLDAAILHPQNGKAYFFQGKSYYRFDFQLDRVEKTGHIGKDGWAGLPAHIEAAVLHPLNGKAYFFQGTAYYRFDFQQDRVEKVGETGMTGWKGLP